MVGNVDDFCRLCFILHFPLFFDYQLLCESTSGQPARGGWSLTLSSLVDEGKGGGKKRQKSGSFMTVSYMHRVGTRPPALPRTPHQAANGVTIVRLYQNFKVMTRNFLKFPWKSSQRNLAVSALWIQIYGDITPFIFWKSLHRMNRFVTTLLFKILLAWSDVLPRVCGWSEMTLVFQQQNSTIRYALPHLRLSVPLAGTW